jgi:hypothetical protein
MIGGVRPVIELQSLRSRGRMPQSDADQLAGVTGLPALLWVGFFGLANVALLGLGLGLLAVPMLNGAGPFAG